MSNSTRQMSPADHSVPFSSYSRLRYSSVSSWQRYSGNGSQPRNCSVGHLQRRVLQPAILCVHTGPGQVRGPIKPTVYRTSCCNLRRASMLPQSHTGSDGPLGVIFRVMLNGRVVRLILLGAVVLGVVGGVCKLSLRNHTAAYTLSFS